MRLSNTTLVLGLCIIAMGTLLSAAQSEDAAPPKKTRALQIHEALTIAVAPRSIETTEYQLNARREQGRWIFAFRKIAKDGLAPAGGHFLIVVTDDGTAELTPGK